MLGFDFSHWNSDTQFRTMSSKADFIFHKISEGTGFIDEKALDRLKDYKGLKGVFHVVIPKKNSDYLIEFTHFCNQIDKVSFYGNVAIALDLENAPSYVPYGSGADIKIWICNFVRALKSRYNKPIFVYMGDLYSDDWYKAIEEAGGIIWICRYRQEAPKHKCALWQYTDKYEGKVLDADKVMDEKAFLEAFGVKEEKIETGDDLKNACSVFADYVIKGYFGDGVARKDNIYRLIQEEVNWRLKK